MGLILVKELLMVDEDAGVHIRDLRLRELPFMRCALGALCGFLAGGRRLAAGAAVHEVHSRGCKLRYAVGFWLGAVF